MKQFTSLLKNLNSKIDLPQPKKSRMLLEIAADLNDMYNYYLAKGLTETEAVSRAIRIAMDFRMVYRKDVVLDIACYRRHGHSEADEPAATQPMMYKRIRQHARVAQLYADQLIEEGLAREFVNRVQNFRKEAGFEVTDHIVIEVQGVSNELEKAITNQNSYICNETLADKISIDSINAEFKKDTKIEDQSIQIGLIINS